MVDMSAIMTFAAYYYDNQFFLQQIKAAGLELGKIESYYIEERRITYNSTSLEVEPAFVVLHHWQKAVCKSRPGYLLPTVAIWCFCMGSA